MISRIDLIIYGEVAQRQRRWTCLIVGTMSWVSTSIRHQKSIQCGFKSHPLYQRCCGGMAYTLVLEASYYGFKSHQQRQNMK